MARHPIRARVNSDGQLIRADPLLLSLQQRAGSQLGDRLAMPQLARLIALSLHARKPMERAILLGDDGEMISAQADVRPDNAGADIEIRQWRCEAITSALPIRQIMRPSPMGWIWECNVDLKLIALDGGPGAPLMPDDWQGRLIMDIFALHSDAGGQFPLLQARGAARDFQQQRISVSDRRQPDMCLSGEAIFDALNQFRGFRGLAEPVRADEMAQYLHLRQEDRCRGDLRFNKRIDEALREPLNRIIAAAKAIADQGDGPVRDDYVRYAGDIADAGGHLLGLVDDLADAHSIERSDFTLASDPIDLVEIARRAAVLLSMKAEEKQMVVHLAGAETPMPATGEFRRALQILLNLLGNAIRYAPAGTSVWLHISRIGDQASVSVRDQGPGIAAEHQQRIFEKFERLGQQGSGGSGLGLYIAKKLAQAMGGDLCVESEAGKGACFTLLLPLRA